MCQVAVRGDFDMVATFKLEPEVDRLLAETRVRRVVVDLAEARFIDSAGVGALLPIRERTEQLGVELILAKVRTPFSASRTSPGPPPCWLYRWCACPAGRSRRRVCPGVLSLVTVLAARALPASASASAEQWYFFEETADANWSVPHPCADGSTVQRRLLVRSTYDFESPDTEDEDPTARVQFLAVCPDGRSFSWARAAGPVTHTSTDNLKSVHVSGAFTARDNSGSEHQVTIDVSWTGSGAIETSVNPTQGFRVGTSTRKERAATATGTVTFDGRVLVSGESNHFLTPFIRTDEGRYTQTP